MPDETPDTPDTPGNNGEPDPSSMAVQLAAYRKALEEEFELTNNPELADPEKLAAKARQLLLSGVPSAVSGMRALAEHADSENVRLGAQKFIIENALGKGAAAEKESALDKMLKELQGNDTPTDVTEGADAAPGIPE